MNKFKYYLDWLFRDLTTRRGKYVIAEVPNAPLLSFMIALVFYVVMRPSAAQKICGFVAFITLLYWGVQEFRSGRSRFRRLLGALGVVAAVGAMLLAITA